MAREIEFLIVCAELFCADPLAQLMVDTKTVFQKDPQRNNGAVLLEVWTTNIRHCTNDQVDAIVDAFHRVNFLNPVISTLTIMADDGSFLEHHAAGRPNVQN
jgi:hypothetical protein